MLDLIQLISRHVLEVHRKAIASERRIAAFAFSSSRSSGAPTAMWGLSVLLTIAGIGAFLAEWAPLAEWRTLLGILASTAEFPLALWSVVRIWKACGKPYRRDSVYRNTWREQALAITVETMAVVFVADFMCQTFIVIAAGSRLSLMFQDLWSFCLGLYVIGAISRSPRTAWRDLKRRRK